MQYLILFIDFWFLFQKLLTFLIKNYLETKELIFNEGQLVDASFTIAPRQRNTREENEKIKKGEGDDLWNDEPHKKCHKDIDARWIQKTRKHLCLPAGRQGTKYERIIYTLSWNSTSNRNNRTY